MHTVSRPSERGEHMLWLFPVIQRVRPEMTGWEQLARLATEFPRRDGWYNIARHCISHANYGTRKPVVSSARHKTHR